MSRPPAITQREKTVLVLEVLAGRLSLARAAHRAGVSAQAVANWRRAFVEGGSEALGPRTEPRRIASRAELHTRQLTREIHELKLLLAEAHVALRQKAS